MRSLIVLTSFLTLAAIISQTPVLAQTSAGSAGDVGTLESNIQTGLQKHLHDYGGTRISVEVSQCEIWIREHIRSTCEAPHQAVLTDMSVDLSEVQNLRFGEALFDNEGRIARFEFSSDVRSVRGAAQALIKGKPKIWNNIPMPEPGSVPKTYQFPPDYKLKKHRLTQAGLQSHSEYYMCTGLIFSQLDVSDLHIHLVGKGAEALFSKMKRYLRHCNPDVQATGAGDSNDGTSVRGAGEPNPGFIAGSQETGASQENEARGRRELAVFIDRVDDELDQRLKNTNRPTRAKKKTSFDGIILNDDLNTDAQTNE